MKKIKKLSYYQKKADTALQEICRNLWEDEGCLICGGTYSCAHHFVKKSQSTALRYDLINCIRICVRCHCSIHQGKNDTVTARIVLIKGEDWFNELMAKKKQSIGQYYGNLWYRNKLDELKKIAVNN